MNISYYKKIVDECPMLFISGKLAKLQGKDELDYIIEDVNKSFLDNINKYDKEAILNKSIVDVLGISKEDLDRFKQSETNGFTTYQYIPVLKDIYKITGELKNNNYFLWLERYLLKDTYIDAVMNNLKSIIWVKDLSGRYIRVNNRFKKVVGLKEEDIIGKKDFEIKTHENFYYIKDYEKDILNGTATKVEKIIYENN
ncbi:MAG: PAS domain-containing protein, partial [Paraclostridium sp.]